jgi:sec-independent protein translocase protein TatA
MEIIVLLVIALIVFGPKRLPELGKSLGGGMREFKQSITGRHDRRAAETEDTKIES